MSTYRHGVLIHNFNEDRFGTDVQSKPAVAGPPAKSVSHLAHNWKDPRDAASGDSAPNAASTCVERYILFGHAGNMRDPHVSLQVQEHATAHGFFMRDPLKLGENAPKNSADSWAVSEEPLKVAGELALNSSIASKVRMNWADQKGHAIPPSQRYKTQQQLVGAQIHMKDGVEQAARQPRPYCEFTKSYDAVKLTR